VTVAVFLEHHEDELQKGSLGVLGKAASLGDDIVGVVLGSDVKELAAGAGKFGARKVYVADAPELAAPPRSRGWMRFHSSSATRGSTRCSSQPPCWPRTPRQVSPRGSTRA
jgi:hypothetical protein